MRIWITVDTEGTHGSHPFQQMVWGDVDDSGKHWGVPRICDIAEEYGFTVSFFVDVYEYSFYGKQELKKLVRYIIGRGHRVELHTHPAWSSSDVRDSFSIQEMKRKHSCFDFQRPWMHQYSVEEQIEILKHGQQLLEDWSGTKIDVHRAGGYGLNRDTLLALRETGFRIDSSMFNSHENSLFTPVSNFPHKIEGVLEIPVTHICLEKVLRFISIPLFKRSRIVKTDINSADFDTITEFIDQGARIALPVTNLFLHSYSFLNWNNGFNSFRHDSESEERFRSVLAFCRARGYQSFNPGTFDIVESKSTISDWVPKRTVDVAFKDYVYRRLARTGFSKRAVANTR